MKLLIHEGQGIWLAGRRLNQGHYRWAEGNGSLRRSFSGPSVSQSRRTRCAKQRSVGMVVSWSEAWEPQETTNDYA